LDKKVTRLGLLLHSSSVCSAPQAIYQRAISIRTNRMPLQFNPSSESSGLLTTVTDSPRVAQSVTLKADRFVVEVPAASAAVVQIHTG